MQDDLGKPKGTGRMLLAAAIATFVIGALEARAQVAAADARLEKIEVTGSNIRRVDTETGLPVQVITRHDIERGGVITAQDILERISANQSYGGWNDSLGVGSTLAGYTGASLRGLGSERTLVLLNGRRVAPYALSGGQSVDLSGIPVSAIERVEVLKDGASAVYGTDAIGGVINFILRKDYQGVELGAMHLGVEHGGGETSRATLTAGWGNLQQDGVNAFLSLDHVRQQALPARDREFSKTSFIPDVGLDGTSTSSFPANIRQRGGFGNNPLRNPTVPRTGPDASSCLPPLSFPTLRNPFACGFDYVPLVDNIARSEKTNAIGRLAWQARPDHLVFAEGSYYRGEFTYKISPTPVIPADFIANPFQLFPNSPFYPTAFVASLPRGRTDLPLQVAYRLSELGPRVNEPEVEQSRFVAGAQGAVAGWDYLFSAGHTANRQVDHYAAGYVSEAGFRQLWNAGVVNPFAPNTAAVVEQLRATQIVAPVSDNRASHTGAELKVSGTARELKAGPLSVAMGLEGRREELRQTNADVLYSGDVMGGGGPAPSLESATRKVWSLFAEANVPVTKDLEANLAIRHDRYSDFGGTTNPKLTLRWQADRNVVLRGSAGTGFRAPTLYDLFVPNFFNLVGPYDDPVRCPVTGSENDCEAFFRSKGGGNPDLKPETSRQVNVGVVLEPVPGISLAVDYYRVRIDDLITNVPDDAIFSDYARWSPTHVFRLPPDAASPSLPGTIEFLRGTSVNAGNRQTSGIDIDASVRFPASAWGRVTASLSGTYVLEYKASEFEDASPGFADLVTGNGAIARWRHHLSIDWASGPWGATLGQTFQLGHKEYDPMSFDPATQSFTAFRRVGSYSILDLQARYAGIKGLTARLGIRNLLDRDPPSAYGPSTFQRGYDPTYADPRGRMFYLSAAYAWR